MFSCRQKADQFATKIMPRFCLDTKSVTCKKQMSLDFTELLVAGKPSNVSEGPEVNMGLAATAACSKQ